MRNFALLLTLILCSCNYTERSWLYFPNSYGNLFFKKRNKSASVVLFDRESKDKGISKLNSLEIIPLVPYSIQHYSNPDREELIESFFHQGPRGECFRQADGGKKMIFNSEISFSYALVSELNSSGIFRNVDYVCEEEISKDDFVITGKILDISQDKTTYTYGIPAIEGISLSWVFGLPMFKIKTNLSLELALKNKNGDVIFKKTYTPNSTVVVQSIFNMKSSFTYPDLISIAYKQFVNDIAKFIN